MLHKSVFDQIPLWLLFLATVTMVFAAIESGFFLAVFKRRNDDKAIDAPIGSVIGGTLGLLAFMLGFTFSMAATRFDTRRQLLLDEVNAIGTTFLRTDFLPDAPGKDIRRLLREYVHLRAEAIKTPATLPAAIARCEALHDEIWKLAAAVAKQDGSSETKGLFIESLNDTIDFHTKRIVVGEYRIPTTIWLALYVVSMLSVAGVGYQFGRAGARDIATSLFLAVAFSIVICLIADLDRVTEGLLQVSQQPMIDLDGKLSASPP